jgi:hypothetical protein
MFPDREPGMNWSYVAALIVGCAVSQGGAEQIEFSGSYSQTAELSAGQVVEVSAGFASPSRLPDNGRLAIEWSGPSGDSGWQKVLHALDPDVYVVYRAPQQVLAANPDFRIETLLSLVPMSFAGPLEEMFWLPSAGWIVTYDSRLPELGQSAVPAVQRPVQRFMHDLYPRSLAPEADRRLRAVAVSMLYQPALNSDPEVVAAAGRIDAGNFRRLLADNFERELRQAAADDASDPKLELTPARIRNFHYFRDFVMPELARENRTDGDSCFSCQPSGSRAEQAAK